MEERCRLRGSRPGGSLFSVQRQGVSGPSRLSAAEAGPRTGAGEASSLDLCAAKLSGKVITRAEALGAQDWSCGTGPKVPLGYGVIGNTTVSGTVILGSSPGIPAQKYRHYCAGFLEFQSELPI